MERGRAQQQSPTQRRCPPEFGERAVRLADAAVTAYAAYYNYHRLHGELGWRTPAEQFDGTPFVDRGFGHVPSLVASG